VAPVWGVLPVHTRSPPATQAAVFAWQINFPPRLALFPTSVKNAQLSPLLAQEAMSRQTVSVRLDRLARMVDHATYVFPALSSPNQEILCVNTVFLAHILQHLVQPLTACA